MGIVVGWTMLAGAALLIGVLKFRKRALGPVLLRLPPGRKRTVLLALSVLLLAAAPAALAGLISLASALVYTAIGALFTALALGGVEFRERGVAVSDTPIRWERVAAYELSEAEPVQLRLKVGGPPGYWLTLDVPPAQRAAVARLLEANVAASGMADPESATGSTQPLTS
jgi:hypothetical protein